MFIVIQVLLILSLNTGLVQTICSNWSAWGACNHACGNAGVQSRQRYRIWATCEGTSQRRSCNRLCYNSGSPRAGYCDCPAEFWGTCCQHACARIDNCQLLECSSGTNQHCNRCEHDFGGKKKAYRHKSSGGYDKRVCEKICSWRRDSTFCYPGNCPSVPSSCRCASGFGGTNCLTISTKPSINYCLITAEVDIGSSVEKVELSCADKSNPVVYSNIVATTVKIDFKTAFRGPTATAYPRKHYINDFEVGITGGTFRYTVTRELSTGKTTTPRVTHNCAFQSGTSQSNPETHIFYCNHRSTLVSTPLRHADRLQFEVATSNGGYVMIDNYESGATDAAKYYSGQTTTHKAELIIDLVKPIHCSVGSTCTDNMLDRGPPITKSDSLTLRWAGWSDSLAGIKLYELAVYKMKILGYKLTHSGETALVHETLDANTRLYNTTLVDPGVYAVVLTAEDNAGNYQAARRFLIFDNINVVSINPADDKVIVVNSAAVNTSYTWLTSLQNSDNAGDQVGISWRGHFANVFHNTHKFLSGSAAYSPAIATGYEETNGQPPDTVSREAIPNVNGIVKYEVSCAVDHIGGRSLNSPVNWVNVNDFQSEEILLNISRADGDSVRVWVKSTDVMGNTKTDSVLVHVDSSPPVIQDVRPGGTHSAEPAYPTYEVDAYDFQSGLKEIHWQIRNSTDHGKVYDSGQMSARAGKQLPSDCFAPGCYCIPKNSECNLRNFGIKPDMSKLTRLHNQKDVDYELVVTVINNAMLTVTSVHAYNFTNVHTAKEKGNTKEAEKGKMKESLPVAAIAGGSAAGVAVIAIATVAAICCLIKKSRTRETHEEANTNESNKESDTETPHYTSLQFNNPENVERKVDDEDAVYQNP